ncbi:MAG: tRNA (adenosine(37)-N6)-dimethylallyltransferase MiaA [Candidatus Saccharimonadales bacterium]|nr:tRNA (adenosine(37)-N6)-dimethylallyltransferase MiaA [Candidatus Saccharimonadales bacterium]
MKQKINPLIAVVGETASGKTSLGIEIAKKHNGEIITADSRSVYRGLDIGTAKPTVEEQGQVTHHLLDIVNPDQKFNVGDFQRLAYRAIADIESRNKLAIMVGGTGLYIDSVLFDYQFSNQNKQSDADRQTMRENCLVIGLKLSRNQLRSRIEKRVEAMFKAGLRKEVDELVEKYGWGNEAMTGIGYREFKPFYDGEISMSKVKRDIAQNTLSTLAKHQRTWFKRNPKIKWFECPADALECVADFLSRQK